MQSRELKLRSHIEMLEKNLPTPNQISHQVAVNSLDERALHIFDMSHAEELFSQGALNLSHLEEAKTLEEFTNLLDNYIDIINFYNTNYTHFHHRINSPSFRSLLDKKGDLNCWNELMKHSYIKLKDYHSTLLIVDTLSRLPSPLTDHHDHSVIPNFRF